MKNHTVNSIEINVPFEVGFKYIANPRNLPLWTNAFKEIKGDQAVMATPQGKVEVRLEVKSSRESGQIDWHMHFPGGETGIAFSRITPAPKGIVYTFLLMAPPGELEKLEGNLTEQSKLIQTELAHLKTNLESLPGR